MIPTERLLKELREKLKTYPNTEKDVENINCFLASIQECPIQGDFVRDTLIEFRKTSELNKQTRRKILKIIADNYFYFTQDVKNSIKKRSHVNMSDRRLISLMKHLIKESKI